MDTRTIFFVGKPGCGKGTQAKLLSEKTGWPIIAAGAQFRQIAKEDSAVGRKTKAVDEQGLLQPPWFAMYLYLKSLFGLPEGTSIIFDGFNRKVPEAELVTSSLKWLDRPFKVINVAISDETMRARLQNRGKEEKRPDDNTFETRLEEYNTHTAKAIELFRNEGVLIEVDGEPAPEIIAEEIKKVLNLQ